MKLGLSLYAMLFVLHGANSFACVLKNSVRAVRPSLRQITKEEGNSELTYAINSGSWRDERSFADVVKCEKKPENLRNQNKSKKEKKSKQRRYILLQPKMNFEKNSYDLRIESSSFNKTRNSAKNNGNKKRKTAHGDNLYKSR